MSDSALMNALGGLSPEKRALLADMLRPAPEPVAIIGLACRFPGGANSPEQFWRNLAAGHDAVTEVPADRWPSAQSAMRYGAFLDQIDQFDAAFFGIAPREAARMDPQQRLFLQVAWEALENAGQTLESLAGSATGIYAAVYQGDYASLQLATGEIDAHVASGMSHAIVANRLSHFLDVRGPSLAIDTACSSSLVALHLAVNSLRAKETDLAVAGGVNLMISPLTGLAIAKWGALAGDGRIKAFDAAADGFVRGEGCGVLVLKRLSEARRAGDPILAVVRGTAVNQDGRTNVLTAPNGLAQRQVMAEALRNAGLRPEQVGYIEAHGTGTPLGDPIEMEALTAVYDQPPNGAASHPDRLWVGSVKTNIGHLEGAAGAAGLIKAVLVLRHGVIPPHLHFQALNPHIELGQSRLAIAAQAQPWPATGTPRRAAVSSFGFGGTNAHILLEEAPALATAASAHAGSAEPPLLLALSAPQPSALPALASAYRAALDQWQADGVALADVCGTAARRRTHFNHRLAVAGRTYADLAAALDAHLAGQPHPALSVGRRAGGTTAGPVFVFSGQGVQWEGMGRALYQLYPIFRAALDECDGAFRPHLGHSLIAAINGEAAAAGCSLADTALAQPAIFAVQAALAALWESMGVRPAAVVGHSLGEVTAAYVAGALTLSEAVQVVIARSRLMQTLTGQGAMAAISQAPDAVLPRLSRFAGLAVAAVNAPASTVVAGDPSELAELLAELEAAGVRVQKLPVNYAFHSPQVRPLVLPLVRELAGLRPQAGRLPLVSTVTGQRLAGERLDAAYWGQNLSESVLFARAIEGLVAGGFTAFVEVSPHPALSQYVKDVLEKAGEHGVAAHSLRKGRDEALTLAANLGLLYTHGLSPDWDVVAGPAARPVALPNYPWQQCRYWFEAAPASARPAATEPPLHPLLARRVRSPFVPGVIFESEVAADSPAFQGDHRIHDVLVVPATTYLEMVSAAGRLLYGAGAHALHDLTIRDALVVPGDGHLRLQLQVAEAQASQPVEWQIAAAHQSAPDDWRIYVRGKLAPTATPAPEAAPFVPAAVQARCPETLDGEAYYQLGRQYGGALGPRFRSIRQLWRGPGEALGRLARAPQLESEPAGYNVHPAYMDAVFHIAYAAQPGELAAAGILMPVSFEQVVYHRPAPASGWCHFKLRSGEAESLVVGDAWLYDDGGALIAEATGIRYLRASGQERLLRHVRVAMPDPLYRVEWQPAPLPAAIAAPTGAVLILAGAGGYGRALAEALRQRGIAAAVAVRGSGVRAVEGDYQLEFCAPEHFSQLLSAVESPGGLQVVNLWPVDEAAAGEPGAYAHFDAAALSLAQAAIGHVGAAVPRLWFVTRHAQAAGQALVEPAGALLWGFGRTLALEYPGVFGGLVDLGDHSPHEAAAWLAGELAQADGETQLAYRGRARLAARLVREPVPGPQPATTPLFAPNAAYLVTGATGGIGRLLVHWLVENGARHLLLVSRQAGPETATWLEALRAKGVKVQRVAVDVAEADALAQALAETSANLPPLRGVFHAAGVVSDAALLQLTPEAFDEVLAAKLRGAWNLHALTASQPLDYFVLFSSAAAVLGSPGQANYAAANAGLDALAHLRRAAGQPALTINWGPWQVGMAAAVGGKGRQRWEAWGMDPLAPEQGLATLARLLRSSAAQVAVLPMPWPPRTEKALAHAQRQPLFRELARQVPAPETARAGPPALRLREALAGQPPRRQKKALVDFLRGQVAAILGWDAAFEIDPRQGLFDLGLDSLTAVELRERIDAALALPQPLPATVAFDYPTLEALAGHLLEKLALTDVAAPEPAANVPTDALDELTEDELAAMLADELREIEKEK